MYIIMPPRLRCLNGVGRLRGLVKQEGGRERGGRCCSKCCTCAKGVDAVVAWLLYRVSEGFNPC